MADRHPLPKKVSAAFLREMAIPCLDCKVKAIIPTRAKSGALFYKCGNHLTVFRWLLVDVSKVSAGASPKTNDGTAPASAASSPPKISAAALLERAEKLGG